MVDSGGFSAGQKADYRDLRGFEFCIAGGYYVAPRKLVRKRPKTACAAPRNCPD
jgi:hypothetical protein